MNIKNTRFNTFDWKPDHIPGSYYYPETNIKPYGSYGGVQTPDIIGLKRKNQENPGQYLFL